MKLMIVLSFCLLSAAVALDRSSSFGRSEFEDQKQESVRPDEASEVAPNSHQPFINARVLNRRVYGEVSRSGEWDVAPTEFGTIYTPLGSGSQTVLLTRTSSDGSGEYLSIDVAAPGVYIITEDFLWFEYLGRPVVPDTSSGYEGVDLSRARPPTEKCWDTDTLDDWTYEGDCWGLTTYSLGTQCWVKKCDRETGDCDLIVDTQGGDPTTYNGDCQDNPPDQTTRCGDDLCFTY